MDAWLINGAPSVSIRPDDRGLAYGDGLFETIAFRAGKCRFIDLHIDRLLNGCERLHIAPPVPAQLLADIATLTAGLQHGTVKIIVTRGPGPRGYRPSSANKITRIVGFAASELQQSLPIKVRYCATPASINSKLAGIKSLNRLEQVLASNEWDDPDITEGLMSNDRNEVVSGTMSNLFIVRENNIYTPPVNQSGVAGVMRQVVMDCAQKNNLPMKIIALSKEMLRTADDVFLTNSLTGIRPVLELDGQQYQRSAITKLLMTYLLDLGVQECRT